LNIYRFFSDKKITYPLLLERVPAGFPSPADDYIDRSLDLNEYLIKHPSATFFIRVTGDSMSGAGIFSGDLLIIDRSIQASPGNIVLAVLNGEFTVKRLIRHGGGYWLFPENPSYNPIQIDSGADFTVWGVVIHVIHTVL